LQKVFLTAQRSIKKKERVKWVGYFLSVP